MKPHYTRFCGKVSSFLAYTCLITFRIRKQTSVHYSWKRFPWNPVRILCFEALRNRLTGDVGIRTNETYRSRNQSNNDGITYGFEWNLIERNSAFHSERNTTVCPQSEIVQLCRPRTVYIVQSVLRCGIRHTPR